MFFFAFIVFSRLSLSSQYTISIEVISKFKTSLQPFKSPIPLIANLIGTLFSIHFSTIAPFVVLRSSISANTLSSFSLTETNSPTAAGTVSCTSGLNITTGKMAVIDFPGGYSAEIKVRYRPEDPNIITGTVNSGDKVYILDGPVCLSESIWWKINSDTQKIVGWIPETIASKPIIMIW